MPSRCELTALRCRNFTFASVEEQIPALLEALGLSADQSARDGEITVRDHGALGCVVVLNRGSLGQRAALALAPRVNAPVQVFEVVGSAGAKAFKFRSAAFEATPAGDLRPAEGEELDFDDPDQEWGGGDLETRAQRVLREFARLPTTLVHSRTVGVKRRGSAKPSSPRVATLLALVKKARSWEGVPQPNGRVELRVELAAGGRQMSTCTPEEFRELEALAAGKR